MIGLLNGVENTVMPVLGGVGLWLDTCIENFGGDNVKISFSREQGR